MIGAIFKNIGQALHFSFLMEFLPATRKGATQVAIENLIRNSGRVFDEPHQSTINFGGLTPLEVRGQCAMVRAEVEHHLLEPEKYAIWARFGLGETKISGIEGMARYIEPICLVKGDALAALLCNFYWIGDEGKRPSLRDIQEMTGIPRSNLARVKQVIGLHAARLELEASDRLAQFLLRDGAIEMS